MTKLRPDLPNLEPEHPTKTELPAFEPNTPEKLLMDVLEAARAFHKHPEYLFDALRKAAAKRHDYQAFYEMDIRYKTLVGEPIE